MGSVGCGDCVGLFAQWSSATALIFHTATETVALPGYGRERTRRTYKPSLRLKPKSKPLVK